MQLAFRISSILYNIDSTDAFFTVEKHASLDGVLEHILPTLAHTLISIKRQTRNVLRVAAQFLQFC